MTGKQASPMRLNDQRFLWVVGALLAAALLSFFFLDQPLEAMVAGLDPRLDEIAQRVTWFGRSTSYLVVFGALSVVLSLVGRAAKRTRMRLLARSWAWASAYLFLVVAVSGLANDLVKVFAGRARPLVADRSWHPFAFSYDYHSFPSGHAAVAFGLAFGVTALWPRWRWPMLVFALAVSASRILLDAHHLADVIGGALVGFITVRWLVAALARRRLVFQMDSDGNPRRRLGPLAQLRHITPA